MLDAEKFASMVDHTLLKPEATEEQIISLCEEALHLRVASVCVNSLWTATVKSKLSQSPDFNVHCCRFSPRRNGK